MGSKATLPAKRRAINKEELRLYLSANNKVRHVIDNIEKLENDAEELDAVMVTRINSAINHRLSLLKKYLPDEKTAAPCIEFDFKKSQKPHEKVDQIIKSISNGEVPPDIGAMLIQSIKSMVDVEEYTELKKRIEALEKALAGES